MPHWQHIKANVETRPDQRTAGFPYLILPRTEIKFTGCRAHSQGLAAPNLVKFPQTCLKKQQEGALTKVFGEEREKPWNMSNVRTDFQRGQSHFRELSHNQMETKLRAIRL